VKKAVELRGKGDFGLSNVVELDRKMSEEVKVFVDGRLFAKGMLGEKDGVATVKLTNLSPRTMK
jgi:flagellar motor switch/type III secretory pathway protein FliN